MTDNRRDLVIFGATGVTGRVVVEKALERFHGNQLVIAGRSLDRLRDLLKELKQNLPAHVESIDQIDIIEAKVSSFTSLVKMCQSAKLVLNCVGPFRFYGEEVVKAALEAHTHYMDISGEPMFLETIESKYSEAAKSRDLYFVGSCGFDSIPADLGMIHLRDNFPGVMTGVESYLSVNAGPSGYVVNYGTWQSAIHGFANEDKLRRFRKSLNLPRIGYTGPSLREYGQYFNHSDFGYCIPFPGSDRSVVIRTQRTLTNLYDLNPIRFKPYFVIGGLKGLMLLLFFGAIFGLLAKFSLGRWLLETFPRVFSFGAFSKTGPSKQQMLEATFSMHFKGQGFASEEEMQSKKQATKFKELSITGPDAGYIGTSIIFLDAALCLLRESDKLPKQGGVYTPGAAFEKTSIIERLKKSGYKIE